MRFARWFGQSEIDGVRRNSRLATECCVSGRVRIVGRRGDLHGPVRGRTKNER